MNGIFLHLLLAEIRSRLAGALVEAVEQRGRSVNLVLDGRALTISLYPECLGMFVGPGLERGYEPQRTMTGMVHSCRITGVYQPQFMPVAKLELERRFPARETMQVIISFYRDAPNFSIVTAAGQRNLFARFVEKEPKSSILDLPEEELAAADAGFIVQHVEGVDRTLAQELNIDTIRTVKSALAGEVSRPWLVSAAPLHIRLTAGAGEEYAGFNELLQAAIRRYGVELEKRSRVQDRDVRARTIRRQIARLRKKLLAPAEIERLRLRGELILANLTRIRRGAARAEFLDPRTNEPLEIPLDPALTPQDNAQHYFADYKKAKRGQPKLRVRIAELSKELAALGAADGAGAPARPKHHKAQPASEPWHKFPLGAGSVVLVGKNARSNDALTFGAARPGDYFFHARGVEGAHTILRSSAPRGQRPPRDEINAAAAIAAHFSKARKQRNVPVSYTQRKFLKKAKKGKPGAVILMREEVVFVDPGLPS